MYIMNLKVHFGEGKQMETDLKAIGRRIYAARVRLGMTQEKLAEQMDVSIQMISNLERGNKEIKITNLIKLASILGTSTDDILLGRESASGKRLDEKIALLSEEDRRLIESIADRMLSDHGAF